MFRHAQSGSGIAIFWAAKRKEDMSTMFASFWFQGRSMRAVRKEQLDQRHARHEGLFLLFDQAKRRRRTFECFSLFLEVFGSRGGIKKRAYKP
jgi:hypothetical protein